MSRGKDYIQTKIGKENLAFLVKTFAKVLPCRSIWEKE